MDGRRRTAAFANGAHSARFSRSAYMISSYHSRLLPAARRRYAKERSRANRCSRGEGRSFYVLPLFLWQRPALARAGPPARSPARLATSSVAERHMCVRHINQDRWCRRGGGGGASAMLYDRIYCTAAAHTCFLFFPRLRALRTVLSIISSIFFPSARSSNT